MKRLLLPLLLIAAAVSFGACGQRSLSPLNPCTINAVDVAITVERIDKVDLLLVIDDSGSMEEEQSKLQSEIPRLIQVLASGEPPEGSGIASFPAVEDLRVGVVSTDMGLGIANDPNGYGCSADPFGKDGLLLRGSVIAGGAPPYLQFDGSDPGGFATDVGALANLGIAGCGFEQQLEAALKAITPSDADITFFNGTRGHGGASDDNRGFVRDNSLLAIIFLTDEDDCSASNPDVFDQRVSVVSDDQNPNLRCWLLGNERGNDDYLFNLDRYVDGFRVGRPPAQLVVAAITGIPEEYNTQPGTPTDFNGLLADPNMVERPDPAMPTELAPACEFGTAGNAKPAIRMARTLAGLAEQGVGVALQSICQENYTGALTVIIDRIANALNATCLPRPLNQDSEGRVTCEIVEYLPPAGGIDCGDLAAEGRVFVSEGDHDDNPDTPDRVGCRICQTDGEGNMIDKTPECIELGSSRGWFYEEGDALQDRCPEGRRQAVSFDSGSEPTNGSDIQFSCLQSSSAGPGAVTIGTSCGADPAICDDDDAAINGTPNDNLTCDTNGTATCQLPCSVDADCVEGGLGGYRCYDPDGEDGPGIEYCVNPTCGG